MLASCRVLLLVFIRIAGRNSATCHHRDHNCESTLISVKLNRLRVLFLFLFIFIHFYTFLYIFVDVRHLVADEFLNPAFESLNPSIHDVDDRLHLYHSGLS